MRLTVAAESGGVHLAFGPRPRDRAVVEGFRDAVIPLNDGRYLRLSVELFLEPHNDGTRLKVDKSIYQYQLDERGDRWVVRYDYLRTPADPHPGMHVPIRGQPHEPDVLPPRATLERVHFPTGRISIEAVIRMLVEQFHVPPNEDAAVWRPVLAESEHLFQQIAHHGISGPAE